jgi:hypothetical protein
VKFKAVIFALALAAGVAQAKEPVWHTARVLAQNYESSPSGAYYAGPLGAGVIGVPIMRQSNVVDLSTDQYTMRLIENIGTHGYIVLPVNAEVRFYRDGNKFVIVDDGGKKHKFGVLAVQAR